MRIPKFEYFHPSSIEESCSLLYKHKPEAKVLAGGTDLFVKMKKKEILPRVVISLKGIQKLDRIEWDEREGLKIGPLVTHDALVRHPIVRERFDFLSEACFKVGTRQVRNMGTLAGNLCNASPSSDASAPLLVLETRLKLVHLYGERTVALEEFFVGPFQTVLHPEEIVAEIQIPKLPPNTAGSYQYIHKASSVGETLVGVAVLITVNPKDSTCQEARIGLSSVAPTPLRARAAEKTLKGKRIDAKIARETAQVVSDEIQPRSRPWYRREMARVLVERAILHAKEKIG
jgi:carbon-monoxide dehydrogenase medium subunit